MTRSSRKEADVLTDKMREAFGYDSFGNSHKLLSSFDRLMMHRRGGVPRAGGDVVCAVCGVKYVLHPPVQGALWATRTCEGIVKL
jgi:hypothetical protein